MLALLAPPVCLVCGGPGERDAALCPPCEAALPWIGDACPRCALPRCTRCPAATAAFEAAYAPFAHAGVARDLLLALKLRRALPAADAMAGQMLRRAPPGLVAAATLVPIPGWTSEHLAEAVGRAAGRPVVRCLTAQVGVPTRQLGRTRAERRARRRLRLAAPPPTPGPVLLVDDVHTTGATLHSAATTLRSAGFLQIAVVTYVRTLTGA